MMIQMQPTQQRLGGFLKQIECVKAYQEKAQELFEDKLDSYGQFIYSASTSLCKPGDIVIFGLNPGQNPAVAPLHVSNVTLRVAIRNLATQNESLIDTQEWLRANGTPYEHGQAPFQQRTRWLLEYLRQPNAVVTNLIFFQTANAAELRPIRDKAQRCWPLHELMLRRTKPRLVIAYGNHAGDFLRLKFGANEDIQSTCSGHGLWRIRLSNGRWEGEPISIVQLPHISRYEPDRRELISVLKSLNPTQRTTTI